MFTGVSRPQVPGPAPATPSYLTDIVTQTATVSSRSRLWSASSLWYEQPRMWLKFGQWAFSYVAPAGSCLEQSVNVGRCNKLSNDDVSNLDWLLVLFHLLFNLFIGSRALSFSDHYFQSTCLSVRMSVRVFKMLLLRQFLSDWADILTRWSPTLGKLVVHTDFWSGPRDVGNDVMKFCMGPLHSTEW